MMKTKAVMFAMMSLAARMKQSSYNFHVSISITKVALNLGLRATILVQVVDLNSPQTTSIMKTTN